MGKAVRDIVREVAAELLDAVRDVPPWTDEPADERREWWHRKNETGVCGHPGCQGRCYCDPETDWAMQLRDPTTPDAPYFRARRIYNRYNVELDGAAPEIGELIANPWMPNANRGRLIELLSAVAERGADGAVGDVLDDPKARAILRALDASAGTLAEIAARTSGPTVSESTARKLSGKLQAEGLIERGRDGWERTAKGAAALDPKGG